jgi:hypothetical protein
LLISISSRMLWYYRWSNPKPAGDCLFRLPEPTISRKPVLTYLIGEGWGFHSQAKCQAVPIRGEGAVGAGTASAPARG